MSDHERNNPSSTFSIKDLMLFLPAVLALIGVVFTAERNISTLSAEMGNVKEIVKTVDNRLHRVELRVQSDETHDKHVTYKLDELDRSTDSVVLELKEMKERLRALERIVDRNHP